MWRVNLHLPSFADIRLQGEQIHSKGAGMFDPQKLLEQFLGGGKNPDGPQKAGRHRPIS
jgi:hypothetical protein